VMVNSSMGGDDKNKNGPTNRTNGQTATSQTMDVGDLQLGGENQKTRPARGAQAAAPNFFIEHLSINGGGDIDASSPSFESGISVGQVATGEATSTSYNIGLGFWYTVGGAACPIELTGDVNLTSTLTSADIIFLVNFVFKSGPDPMPCQAAGDVNCSGTVTSADIIYLVNHVFKSGPLPCDVCTVIPSVWSCP